MRFAAERTLLAWIRTSLALMGLGFVVARFGMFLQELAATDPVPAPRPWSLLVGVALVATGILVALAAAREHARIVHRLSRGEPYQAPRWPLGIIVAVLLALIGVGLIVYLLVIL